MNYYIVASSNRNPASEKMIVWLVVLPTPCLECFYQKASSVGAWCIDPRTYCSGNESFILSGTVGREYFMFIVDQTCHAWKGIPHLMEFCDQFLIVRHQLLSPLEMLGLRSITRSSVDRSINTIPATVRGVSAS